MTDSQPTPDPSRSYGSVAEAYDRGRPGYPADAVRWLLGEEPRIVLELGAGTGKLTATMVDLGHAVHAVEPDLAMLQVLEREVPGASAKQASAEEIPANDHSVDVVVVGQAFHWFDHARALPEIARVLRPGGEIALVWNSPDLRIPWVRRLCELIGHQDQNVSSAEELVTSGLFGFVEEKTFKAWQDVHRESIVDLALSRSGIASLGEAARADKLAEVVAFYDDYGRGMDGMQIPYQVRCFKAAVVERTAPTGAEPDTADDAPAATEPHPLEDTAAGRAPEAATRAPRDDGDDMLLIDFR